MPHGRRGRRLMGEINVVPYIDVMLVLLIIFMVTAPMLSQGIKVDLPKAAAEPIEPDDLEPLLLSVDAAGAMYLNLGNPRQALGHVQQATLATVAPAIAEALIATAMGLFAAIPAVIAYNRYADQVGRLELRFDTFMEELSTILQRHSGVQPA